MPSLVPPIVLGDDNVLRHVDKTTRKVARVGGLKRRVGQAFTCTVRRDEVFEHRQSFAEVRGNRRLDDFAGGSLAISPRIPES